MASKFDLSSIDLSKIQSGVAAATSQASSLASTSNVSGIADSLTKTASAFTKDASAVLKDSKMGSIADIVAKGNKNH